MEAQGLSIMNHIHEQFLKDFICFCGGNTCIPELYNVHSRLSYSNHLILNESIKTHRKKMEAVEKRCREFLDVFIIKDHDNLHRAIIFKINAHPVAEKQFQDLCNAFKSTIADFNNFIEQELNIKDFVQVIQPAP